MVESIKWVIKTSTSPGRSTRTNLSLIATVGNPFFRQVLIDVLLGLNVTTASFLFVAIKSFTMGL